MMRLPRVRFTVRRMMIAVAVVALAIGMVARSRQMSKIADRHAAQILEHSQMMPLPNGAFAALLDNRGEWHQAMVAKYRRVARFPWLPVEPDPPEPE